MHPFLLIRTKQKHGMSHKEIVTIGIAHVVAWDEQSKNTDVWYRVAGYWLKRINFTLSLSPVGERK
jgi:hypothetical protein